MLSIMEMHSLRLLWKHQYVFHILYGKPESQTLNQDNSCSCCVYLLFIVSRKLKCCEWLYVIVWNDIKFIVILLVIEISQVLGVICATNCKFGCYFSKVAGGFHANWKQPLKHISCSRILAKSCAFPPKCWC